MARRSGTARDPRTEGLDHLERLCACLVAAASLVRAEETDSADERVGALQRAYKLDVRAFEMAVEAALFLETAVQGTLVWNREMRERAGTALTALTDLSRSCEASVRQSDSSERGSGDFLSALRSLSETVSGIRGRLESVCRSMIMTELCSFALVSRVRMRQDGARGDRSTSGSSVSFGVRRD